jgi:hypothetical protein
MKNLWYDRYWAKKTGKPIIPIPANLTLKGTDNSVADFIANSPAVNLRFNESPIGLLQNVVKIGKSIRVFGGEGGGMIVPSLVVKDLPFTSVSDAV